MAKTITDEEIKLSIIINGNPAQKQLSDLTRTNIELKKVVKELNIEESNRRKELEKLSKEYGINSKLIGDNELMVKKLTTQYNDEKVKLKSLEDQYGKNSSEYKKHNSLVNSLLNSSIKYENSIEKLKEANAKLSPEIDKNSKEYKELKDRIKSLNTEIDNNVAKMNKLQSEIGITSLSIGQLQQKANLLRATLRTLAPDTADFKKYDAELKQVTTRLGELTGKAQTSKFSISSIADGFNKYAALGASVVATFTGVVLSMQKIIDMNGKLSDAQADVMKTTGMTKNEVDDLTKSFGALETRTSRIDLLKIAEQGGRLGIPKAEIQDFVKTMNMAAVSLGDSFEGGVDQVAEKLGKIKFLFKETKDMNVEQAYNSIGSAINDLGANGTANEQNIAEFTQRIGSLTDVLKPSVAETLALGTAFEESGIEAETASRAYNIFMKQASTESEKFAKVMGISKKAVEDMINTNPMDFMLEFSKGMRGMDATQVAKTLDFLGVNADGANKVVGAMGNNFERFHELIDISNNSFATGTSLISEYNIKNETLGATLEKINKKVSGWFSSETFIKWLTSAAQSFAKFIGASEDANKSVSSWKIILAFTAKLLVLLISTMISFSIASRVAAIETKTLGMATAWNNIQSKLNVMWLTLQKTALMAYSFVMSLLGKEITATTVKIRALNAAGASSPWGAIIAVVAAVIGAYLTYRSSLQNTIKTQETFASQQKEIAKELGESTAQTKAHITSLVNIINDGNVSLATRKKAYEELIKIAPEFNGLIIKEGKEVTGLTTIYNDYLKALDQVAYAKAIAKLNESNIEKEVKDTLNLYNAEKKYYESKRAYEDAISKDKGKRSNDIDFSKRRELISAWKESETEFENAKKALENTKKIVADTNAFKASEMKVLQTSIETRQKELNILENKYGKEIADKSSRGKQLLMQIAADKKSLDSYIGLSTTTDSSATSNYNVPETEDKTKKAKQFKSLEEMAKERLDFETKTNDDLLKLERQYQDDSLSIKQDGISKELSLENQRYQREIADLERQKVHSEEMAKLDVEIAKAKADGDTRYYNFLIQLKKDWQKKNEAIDAQITNIQENKLRIHNLKLATIYENAEKKRIEEFQKSFEHEKMLRETAFNNQLALLGNNEKAKEALKKEYDQNELKATEEHLQKLIKIIKANMALGDAFNLLNPVQKKKLQDDLDFALNALSKIQAAKTGEKSKGDKIGDAAKSAFGQTDILGFTSQQWQDTFKNISTLEQQLSAVNMVVTGLQNMWSAFSNLQTASENRNLKIFEQNSDKKKLKLKRQLDAGYITQAQYDKQIKRLDDEYNKQKLEAEYKQAKRDKAQALFGAIVNTAKGITAAIPNPFLMSLAAIVGGLQIATIAKTPLPARGFEEGLYPVKREQDGKIFQSRFGGKTKSGLVNKPTYFLTGENGPEMIIDSRAYSQISPETKNALLRELRGIKGFENGLYNQSTQRFEVPTGSGASSSNNSDKLLEMALVLISENTAVLKDLRDNPIRALVDKNDKKSMKNIKEGVDDYKAFRDKNKF